MDKVTRREFLGGAAALLAAPLMAVSDTSEPILDLHQHTPYSGRSDDQLITHQRNNGVTITNLLAGDGWLLSVVGGNADCAALQAKYPDQFVRFACADPVEGRMLDIGGPALEGPVDDLSSRKPSRLGLSWPSATAKLRTFGLGSGGRLGAIGIGEMKFHVPVDSPEMDRVYKLAEELRVPVLLHFEYQHYNLGIEKLEDVLKAYPKVNFIGHAQTWWAYIGADCDPSVMYPTGTIKRGGLTDRLLGDYSNLYCDLSGHSGLNALTRDSDFTADFLARHHRKLIWGSDCSCRDGKGAGTPEGYCTAQRCLQILRKFVSDPARLRRILYGNGAELLRLKES